MSERIAFSPEGEHFLPDNLVLIGLTGAGKTTTAEAISQISGRRIVDTDQILVQEEGVEIGDIVQANGWDYFRHREAEVVRAVSKEKGIIISTGGGAIERAENREELARTGYIVHLHILPETAFERVEADGKNVRPGSSLPELKERYDRRIGWYSEANLTIDVNGLTPEIIARTVIENFTSYQEDIFRRWYFQAHTAAG